ncbi:MAG: hypothetical protein JSS27_04715 [Planctomycetes bacterium]|nr:hypothetical protein [Planctomycetota bacterium]
MTSGLAPQPAPYTPPQDEYQDEGFYQQYSPNHELPKSSLASCLIHGLLAFIIGLLATITVKHDPEPPGVDVVRVSDDATAAPDFGDGNPQTPSDVLPNQTQQPTMPQVPTTTPTQDVKQVEVAVNEQINDRGKKVVGPTQAEAASAQAAAAQAASAFDAAKKKLAENVGKGGGGGSGPSGTAARRARWVITYRPASGSETAQMLQFFGAEVAVPIDGGNWRYFSDLTSRPPKSWVQTLDDEIRMSWSSESMTSNDRDLLRVLGAGNASGFYIFFPRAFEARLSKLELAYRNVPEEDIASTVFEMSQGGSGWDVRVSRQSERR